jgi:hypothetical protein
MNALNAMHRPFVEKEPWDLQLNGAVQDNESLPRPAANLLECLRVRDERAPPFARREIAFSIVDDGFL